MFSLSGNAVCSCLISLSGSQEMSVYPDDHQDDRRSLEKSQSRRGLSVQKPQEFYNHRVPI